MMSDSKPLSSLSPHAIDIKPSNEGGAKKSSLPKMLDGEFFEVVKEEEGRITARCVNCPGNKLILGTSTSTGNYISHLKRIHPDLVPHLASKQRAVKRRKSLVPLVGSEGSRSPQKPQKHHDGSSINTLPSKITQNEINSLVMNFIVDEALPLSYCKKPGSFRNLLDRVLLGLSLDIPDTNDILAELARCAQILRQKTEQILQQQRYICISSERFTPVHDSKPYLLVTAHYIDEKSLQRKTLLLEYCRFKLRASTAFNNLEQLRNKIVYHVTNTLSDSIFYDFLRDSVPNVWSELASDDSQSPDNLRDSPESIKCWSRLLSNMLRDKWAKDWGPNPQLNVFRAKHALSTTCYETDPEFVEWEMEYNAIAKILSLVSSKGVHEGSREADVIQSLSEDDITGLKEFTSLVEPFVKALDIVHQDSRNYLGMVLPTVFTLKRKLQAVTNLVFCHLLKEMLIEELMKDEYEDIDFNDIGNPRNKSYVIAAITHPRFKLYWVPDSEYSTCKKLFISECKRIGRCKKSNAETPSDKGTSFDGRTSTAGLRNEDEFYSCLLGDNSKPDNAEMEAVLYLNDKSTELEMLHKYPCVKELFLKYNSCLASSRPVERIIMKDSQVLFPEKLGLTDFQFEMLLLLRNNKWILETESMKTS